MTGELVYEGKNVMMGYAKERKDLSEGDGCGGILFTGDMAKRDEEGFYYIEGRKKRFLKLYGNRISLDGTERLLKQNFGDCEFACTGNDEGMNIFTSLTGEEWPEKEEILLFLEGTMKLPGRLFRVIPVDQIPRNEAGKVQYKMLEELL